MAVATVFTGCAHRAGPPIGLDEARPNVILVSIDTVRGDAISVYGKAPRETTPNIDRFARGGSRFTNAFVNSTFTPQSHMSMLTGLYPTSHQFLDVIGREAKLRPNVKTLAQILDGHGYQTTAFVAGFPYINPDSGFARGFDEFFTEEFCDDPALVPRWIERHRGGSFFLFLHSWMPHSPYLVPKSFTGPRHSAGYAGRLTMDREEFADLHRQRNYAEPLWREHGPVAQRLFQTPFWKRLFVFDKVSETYWSLVRADEALLEDARFLRHAYLSALSFVDAQFQPILDALERTGLDKSTIIVITSDHGEAFLEHGMFFHQNSYNEVLRVPLIVVDPRSRAKFAREISPPVQSVDIVPTLLDLLDIRSTEYLDGKSLVPWMGGEAMGDVHDYVFSYTKIGQSPQEATIQNREWKIFHSPDRAPIVFHLRRDPGELSPLGSRAVLPEDMRRLKAALSRLIGEVVP